MVSRVSVIGVVFFAQVLCFPEFVHSAQSTVEKPLQAAEHWRDLAQAKAKDGQYESAIECYEKAISSESSRRKKQRLEKSLEEVKQGYYLELVKQAQSTLDTQRLEALRCLTRARELGVEEEATRPQGFLEKMFSSDTKKRLKETVSLALVLRTQLFSQLQDESREAVKAKRYPEAVRILGQARQLDPQLFEDRNLHAEQERIRAEIELGKKLAEAGRQLLQQQKHSQALAKFREAHEVYPDQRMANEGISKIAEDGKLYEQNLKSGHAALEQGRIALAIEHYEKAAEIYPEFAEIEQVKSRIEGLRGWNALLRHARDSMEKGDLSEALDAYRNILNQDPANREAQTTIPKIESQVFLLNAQELLAEKQFRQADRLLGKALARDPANLEAAGLLEKSKQYQKIVRRGRAFHRERKCKEAKVALRQARVIYPKRFVSEGLETLLNQECAEPVPVPVSEIRRGLRALTESQPQRAISILEGILNEAGEGQIHVHAFLGAAYALASALEEDSDPAALENARAQFRIVLDLNPNFKLSRRLFSPKILEVFEQVSLEGT
jgi:tetratricopeptide (TPR) repeat protein